MKIRILTNVQLLTNLKIEAIVIYPFIFFSAKDPDPVVVSHEFIHIAQIEAVGVFRFYGRYLWEYLLGRQKGLGHYQAYREISFEQEAYLKQGKIGVSVSDISLGQGSSKRS